MGSLLPGVTVVMPTHNRWSMLRTALWSALRQEGVEPGVVVVDDGSVDETAERLAEVRHDRVRVVRLAQNQGVAAARNRGLEEVRTEWVTFLDDDDVWAPTHLAGVLDAAVRASDGGRRVDVAYSGAVMVTGERAIMRTRPAPAPERVPQGLRARNVLLVPSRVLIRTEAVRAAGGFDRRFALAADWDLWLRIVDDGATAASSALSVGYTLHGGNMHLDMPRAIEELRRLEERHADSLGLRERSFVDHCSRWIAASYRARGDRGRAALWYLRAFRLELEPRDFARAAGVLLGERVMALRPRNSGARPASNPAPWLESMREVDCLPPEEIPFA